MPQFFCPACFAEVEADASVCPHCSVDIAGADEASRDYVAKLIHALRHPIEQTRMGAIIALGAIRQDRAAGPLVDCALDWPLDVWQGIEIIRSLRQLPWTDATRQALMRLRDEHPAAPLRRAAAGAVRAFEVTGAAAPRRELNLAKYLDQGVGNEAALLAPRGSPTG
jgi:HEAT repeat protein